MAKLPERWIADLLSRVDLVDLIDERLTLRKAGGNFVARCPFHDEKSPSFSVSRDKQFFHCFGCGAHGDALAWLQEYDRLPFREAVETLAARVGLALPVEAMRPEGPAEVLAERLYHVQACAAKFYRQALKAAPHAVEYLKGRGVTGEVAQRFRLGYAPAGWRNLPTDWPLGQLEAAGLVIAKEDGHRYDRFRDRIMFPIRDPRGRVLGFGGRVINPEHSPKYMNSPESPVFHKGKVLYGLYEALQADPRPEFFTVVEGNLDVVALAQHGLPNVVATLGTAPSADHAAMLFRYTRWVVFCFDGDAAGRKAARKALEASLPALRDGRAVAFVFLPEGADPDSLIREEGAEAFRARLLTGVRGSEFLFQEAGHGAELGTLEGRAVMAAQAREWIGRLPAGEFRALMERRLDEVTGRVTRAGVPKLITGAWSVYEGAARGRKGN